VEGALFGFCKICGGLLLTFDFFAGGVFDVRFDLFLNGGVLNGVEFFMFSLPTGFEGVPFCDCMDWSICFCCARKA